MIALGNVNLIRRLILSLILCSFMVRGKTSETVEQLTFSQHILYIVISIFLCSLAGICSGLTVGYMSINKQKLIVSKDSQDLEQANRANTILTILQNHHLLLCTLLLTNALCMEALPIFLDKVVPAYLAIFISTIAVLIVGEVLPQAYCTGANQIPIAYKMAGFVKFLEFILTIFVKPIAWFLDTWLGHNEDKIVLTKDNIKTLFQLHNSKQYGYRSEQIEILQRILDIRLIHVESVMIPINRVIMLDMEQQLTPPVFQSLNKHNLSIIPVYAHSRDDIKGVIKTRSFLGIRPDQKKQIKDVVKVQPVVYVVEGRSLLDVFDLFKNEYYMCFVLRAGGVGIQTYDVLPKGRQVIGIINLKLLFQTIVNKKFGDRDVHHKFISADFNNVVRPKKKVHYEIEEAKEQD